VYAFYERDSRLSLWSGFSDYRCRQARTDIQNAPYLALRIPGIVSFCYGFANRPENAVFQSLKFRKLPAKARKAEQKNRQTETVKQADNDIAVGMGYDFAIGRLTNSVIASCLPFLIAPVEFCPETHSHAPSATIQDPSVRAVDRNLPPKNC
jgi:hypothetical protein